MKTTIYTLLLAVSIVSLFSSCQKESLKGAPGVNTTNGSATREVSTTNNTGAIVVSVPTSASCSCPTTTVSLIAGQNIDAGTVSVTNDLDFIYVTYNTANGYVLTQTHLFVGDCEAVPVNKKGNPVPGQFPYSNEHNNATSFTYRIPVSAIGLDNCGCIAAHAAVIKLDADGNIIK